MQNGTMENEKGTGGPCNDGKTQMPGGLHPHKNLCSVPWVLPSGDVGNSVAARRSIGLPISLAPASVSDFVRSRPCMRIWLIFRPLADCATGGDIGPITPPARRMDDVRTIGGSGRGDRWWRGRPSAEGSSVEQSEAGLLERRVPGTGDGERGPGAHKCDTRGRGGFQTSRQAEPTPLHSGG